FIMGRGFQWRPVRHIEGDLPAVFDTQTPAPSRDRRSWGAFAVFPRASSVILPAVLPPHKRTKTDCRELGKSPNGVQRRRFFAPAHRSIRNALNKSGCEPTSDHSTNYGTERLIPAFCDTGRTFS